VVRGEAPVSAREETNAAPAPVTARGGVEEVADAPVTIIEASKGWVDLKLKELWEYRELLYFLTWRDIKVRYKQTVLGASWAILQPFLLMVVFTFVGGIAELGTGGIPRPIFTFAALVPWAFFENGIIQSSNSLVGNSNLITKVYFPRLTIPISAVLSGAVDFVIAFGVLIGMMVYFGIVPTANVIFLPAFLLLALIAALAVGLWLSAMNVQFRDVKYVETLVSVAAALVLFVSGLFYFRRMEKSFADVV
jgi:lipopolysaccharide transport system permease protein